MRWKKKWKTVRWSEVIRDKVLLSPLATRLIHSHSIRRAGEETDRQRRSHVPFVTAAMPFPGPLTVPFGARIVHNRGTPRDKGPRWTEDERRTDEPRIGLSFTSFVVRLSLGPLLPADPLSLTPFVTRDATVRSGPGLRPRVKRVVRDR